MSGTLLSRNRLEKNTRQNTQGVETARHKLENEKSNSVNLIVPIVKKEELSFFMDFIRGLYRKHVSNGIIDAVVIYPTGYGRKINIPRLDTRQQVECEITVSESRWCICREHNHLFAWYDGLRRDYNEKASRFMESDLYGTVVIMGANYESLSLTAISFLTAEKSPPQVVSKETKVVEETMKVETIANKTDKEEIPVQQPSVETTIPHIPNGKKRLADNNNTTEPLRRSTRLKK